MSETDNQRCFTCGIESCLISSNCCFNASRRFRFPSTSCRYRWFSSSVRTSSSLIPTSKHRRSRHDEHRRICRYRAILSRMYTLSTMNADRSRCRQGRSRSCKKSRDAMIEVNSGDEWRALLLCVERCVERKLYREHRWRTPKLTPSAWESQMAQSWAESDERVRANW